MPYEIGRTRATETAASAEIEFLRDVYLDHYVGMVGIDGEPVTERSIYSTIRPEDDRYRARHLREIIDMHSDDTGRHLLAVPRVQAAEVTLPIGAVQVANEQGFARLNEVDVRNEFRGMGIGTQLMKRAVEWAIGARGNDRDFCELEVVTTNDSAKDLYRKLGFTPVEGGQRALHNFVDGPVQVWERWDAPLGLVQEKLARRTERTERRAEEMQATLDRFSGVKPPEGPGRQRDTGERPDNPDSPNEGGHRFRG